MIAPLLGFAKEGTAEGNLLYVNYGRTEDFEVLKNNFSISNCSGYIVIMRYGKIFRGDKVKNAQDCGANGAILYNDPKDYAILGQDKVYPQYIWLPKTGVSTREYFQGSGRSAYTRTTVRRRRVPTPHRQGEPPEDSSHAYAVWRCGSSARDYGR